MASQLFFSKFYGGFFVDASSFYLPFKESALGPELNAEVEIGSYSAIDFCNAVAAALNAAGANSYSVSFSRTSRLVTITANAPFKLLGATGTTVGQSILPRLGFSLDSGFASSATATNVCGYEYRPQFPIQDYLASKNNSKAIDASVNKSASGIVQVVRFGVENLIKFSIQYANNEPSDSPIIRQSATAVDDLNSFLLDAVQKSYIEFMVLENEPENYEILLLESTEKDSKGVGYELKEMISKKLYGYFETGILTFKKIEV